MNKLATVLCALSICSASSVCMAGQWKASCEKDAMTDEELCKVVNSTAHVMAFFKGPKRRPTLVCLYMHDFPGREGQIRIDKNKAVSTDSDGCVSAAVLLGQMKKGSVITTRAYEWPYDYPKDHYGSLDGFAAAISALPGP